jgi:4-amino-4-deoxy-L-arabinose transferase-like glycosyltransferase
MPPNRNFGLRNKDYLFLIVILTLSVTGLILEFGFMSIDESSYFYLTKMIAEKSKFSLDTDYSILRSPLSKSFLGVVSGDNVYSAFPPGYPFLATPFFLIFGLNGMQITNVFFTILLVLLFYFFTKDFYSEEEAFLASMILLLGTQVLNYSVSLWSHVPAAFFILLSFYLLFRSNYLIAGFSLGASVVIRYSSVVIIPIVLLFLYKKNKKIIPRYLIALLIGISPLLFYNYVSFGSPFVSGMSLLNSEEGYRAVDLQRIPKGFITNVLHYTFFPELEYVYDKSSLLETSPLFIFYLFGTYLFWKEKENKRDELYTLVSSTLIFIFFISGTWSLGGLAHNMRLLTDIVPLITFFSILPIFHLGLNYKKTLTLTSLSLIFLYLYGIQNYFLKFFNLVLAMIAFTTILALLLLRKDYSVRIWRGLLSGLIILTVTLSIFNAIRFTQLESANRKDVRLAAEEFEISVPENAVVLIFGGDYPTFTNKNYLFLDYRHGFEDIPRAMEYYKNRSVYVLFKDQADKEGFTGFDLIPAQPIRTYKINIE